MKEPSAPETTAGRDSLILPGGWSDPSTRGSITSRRSLEGSGDGSGTSAEADPDEEWKMDFIANMPQEEIKAWMIRLMHAYKWDCQSRAIMAADLLDELNGLDPYKPNLGSSNVVRCHQPGSETFWEVW